MPIYEYFCFDCRKRVSVLFRTMAEAGAGASACPECAGTRLQRLMSRLRVLRSEENRIESMAEDASLLSGLEQEDPRALAHFMRKMSDETGEPLDEEMTEVVDRLESGESPESIESSMPDGDGGDDTGLGGMGAL
ncbi:MAG: zinc ribbon domain-containing protein [Caldilineaceae bacterium]|nr:zinc ribbon domain-containing protein [Caldilineaceae bacterium]